MNIFDHLIPDNAILGIGPLMLQYTTDPAEDSLYASRRYFFDLHLAAHTTRVDSDWFRVKDNVEQQKQMQQWREKYLQLREQVAKTIGEITDARKEHEAAVDKVYKESLSTFEDLLNLLTPSDEVMTAVNLKTQRLAANIEEFKSLALK